MQRIKGYANSMFLQREKIEQKRLILGVYVIIFSFFTLFLFTIFNASSLHAQTSINTQMTYQGRLTSSTGDNVADGSYNFVFALYDASGPGARCLWISRGSCGASTTIALSASNGIFSVNLGDTSSAGGAQNAITVPFFDGMYLGVTVGSDPEMTPRKRLTATPFAHNADMLDGMTSAQAGSTTSTIVATTQNGNVVLTGTPTSSAISGGTLYINPATANVSAGETLFGIAVGNAPRFSLDAEGDLVIQGSVSSTLGISSSSTLQITGGTTLYSTLQLGGISDTTLNYNAIANSGGSTASRTNAIDADNDLYIEGSLETDGVAYFDSGVIMSTTTVLNTITATGRINAGGANLLAYNAFSDAGGTADHTDVIIGDDDVYIEGGLEVDTLSYFDAGVIVTGSSTFSNSLFISNTLRVGGAGGDTTPGYNMFADVDGAASHTDLIVSDDDVYIEGSLEIDGTLFLDNASAVSSTGAFAFGGGTLLSYNTISDAGGAASHAGESSNPISSDDDLYIEGSLEVDGMGYFDSGLLVYASSTINNELTVTGTSTFRDKVDVVGKVVRPRHAGKIASSTALDGIYEVFVQGDYAYALSSNQDRFTIVNVASSSNPFIMSSLASSTSVLLDSPERIFVAGDYAYVAADVSDAVVVIDVSNAASPTVMFNMTSSTVPGALLEGPQGIFVSGPYLYVVTGDSALNIINIANPANPTFVGAISNSTFLPGPGDVVVQGNFAYILYSTGGNEGITIVDVSQPSAPKLAGTLQNTTLFGQAFKIAVVGSYLYTVTSDGTGSLTIVDVSNPYAPRVLATLNDGTGGALLGGAVSVSVSGNYAYVVSVAEDALEIIDISNPLSPTHVGSLTHGSGGASLTDSSFVFIQGNYAYVSSNADDTLEIIDITGVSISNAEIGSLQSGNLQVMNAALFDSGVIVKGGLSLGGGLFAGGASSIYGGLTIASSTATSATSSPQLKIVGAADYSPRMFEWQTSTGTPLGYIDSSGELFIGNGSNITSTVQNDLFRLAMQSSDLAGLFNVDASGNVNASGTLNIFGNTTFGNATSSDIMILNSRVNGSIIPTANSVLDLGEFTRAWDDIFTSGTLYITRASTTNSSIFDWAADTNGNTNRWLIPRRLSSACGSGVAEGIIFQTASGTQVGHACIDAYNNDNANNLMKWYASQFNTSATDVAENYSDVDNILEPGDVVSLDTRVLARSGVVKSAQEYDAMLLGVISTEPGFVMTGIAESDRSTELINPKPVALAGRVPVKVTSGNGAIQIGDYLTSSDISGVAQKATQAGPVIGRALTVYEGPTDHVGSVIIVIDSAFWPGPQEEDNSAQLNDSFLDAPDKTYHNLTVTGILDLTGHDIVNIGRIAGVNELWSIDADGSIRTKATFSQTVTTQEGDQVVYGMVSPDVAVTFSGSGMLSNGQAYINILDIPGGKLFSESVSERGLKIFVTVTSRSNGVYVKEKSLTGFIVEELQGGQSSATFDWMIVGYKKGYEPEDPSKDIPEDILMEEVPLEDTNPEDAVVQPLPVESGASSTVFESTSSTEPLVEEVVVTEPIVETVDSSTTTPTGDDEAVTPQS